MPEAALRAEVIATTVGMAFWTISLTAGGAARATGPTSGSPPSRRVQGIHRVVSSPIAVQVCFIRALPAPFIPSGDVLEMGHGFKL